MVLLNAIEDLLLATPWWLIVTLLVGMAWLATRKWRLPLVVFASLIFLGVMDLWEDAMTTTALMLAATLTTVVIAIPLGIWMSRSLATRHVIDRKSTRLNSSH